MTIEARLAKMFALDDRTWLRHANPWSVWTRNTVLPLLILAVWSRLWLGWWCLLPVVLVLLWNWANPLLFPQPKHMGHWASQAVLGERVWMARKQVPVPEHHRMAPNVLSTVAAVGAIFVIYGVWHFHVWATLLGAALVYAGKLWFLDRMAWLFREMSAAHPAYAAWMR